MAKLYIAYAVPTYLIKDRRYIKGFEHKEAISLSEQRARGTLQNLCARFMYPNPYVKGIKRDCA